jgi:PAS domain S-box-containing protein
MEITQTGIGFEELFQALPLSLIITRASNGLILYANMRFADLLKMSPDTLIGNESLELYADPHVREKLLNELQQRGLVENREVLIKREDGTHIWLVVSMRPITYRAAPAILTAVQDITERKRAEETRLRLASIVESSDDAIIGKTLEGIITSWNAGAERMYGYSADEMRGRSIKIVFPPDRQDEFEEIREKLIEGKRIASFDWIAIHQDITERKRAEEQLRQMLAHETELSELKSRYVSMAAHDLRNPLAVIQSTVSLIHQYGDRLTTEKLQEKHEQIQTTIRMMVAMLDDILILGKAESGKLAFDPAPLDVVAFCENIVAEMKQTTVLPQPIIFSGQGDCRIAMLDAKLLRHILSNLLSNAIKYSPADRPVTFDVHCSPDQITFRVQDQGIGIPEDDQKRLFDTFHRASNVRHIPGTGLGLAIVKQSVDLHGGTITFESEEGVGTTFTVIIPQIPSEECKGQ